MKEKISLEASGMPGVIKTMEKHFGKLIEKASGKKKPVSVKTVPTSDRLVRYLPEIDVILGVPRVIVGAPDKGRIWQGSDDAHEWVDCEDDPTGYYQHVRKISILAPAKEMFSIMVCRDFLDDEFEVLVEILDYVPEHQGGCHDERLASSVEMGDAFTLQGKQIELTELELDRAAEGALAMIESRK